MLKKILAEHQKVMSDLDKMDDVLNQTAQKIIEAIKKGGTIFWMGNGGSASDAQHMAAELMGRFQKERKALASLALTTDTSLLTALSNDYDFSIVFARQLEGLCKKQDVVIGLSTSGNSENVIKGIEMAKSRGALTIGFVGHEGGKLKNLVDIFFVIPSKNTARIQEATTLLCHTLCEMVEEVF